MKLKNKWKKKYNSIQFVFFIIGLVFLGIVWFGNHFIKNYLGYEFNNIGRLITLLFFIVVYWKYNRYKKKIGIIDPFEKVGKYSILLLIPFLVLQTALVTNNIHIIIWTFFTSILFILIFSSISHSINLHKSENFAQLLFFYISAIFSLVLTFTFVFLLVKGFGGNSLVSCYESIGELSVGDIFYFSFANLYVAGYKGITPIGTLISSIYILELIATTLLHVLGLGVAVDYIIKLRKRKKKDF